MISFTIYTIIGFITTLILFLAGANLVRSNDKFKIKIGYGTCILTGILLIGSVIEYIIM